MILEVLGVVFMVVGLSTIAASDVEEATPVMVGLCMGVGGLVMFLVGLFS